MLRVANRRRLLRSVILIAGAMAAASTTARAQALADRVPADALAYFGWGGAEAARASGYAGTRLEALLAQSRVHEVFGSYLDTLEEQIVQRESRAAEVFVHLRKIGGPAWRFPSAVAVVRRPAKGDQPPIGLLVVTRAGGEAAALADAWTELFADTPEADRPRVQVLDELVLLSIHAGDDAARSIPTAVNGLGSSDAFKQAVQKSSGVKSPVLVAYADVQAWVGLLEATAPKGGPAGQPAAGDKISTFLDASGLRGVQQITCTAGFDGKDWVTTRLVGTSGPRAGLLTAWPDGSVDSALMSVVPADATFVSSVRFDAAVFIRQLQESLGRTDPEARAALNKGLGAVQAVAGTNLVTNLLEPLGADWVAYNAPRVGTPALLGTVVANKPEDPERVRRALNAITTSLANWATVGLERAEVLPASRRSPEGGAVRAQQANVAGVKLTYLTLPVVAPAWAIDDGKVFFGFYPQTVASAVREARKKGPSIVENDVYRAAIAGTGVKEPRTVTFNHLPAVVGRGSLYSTFLVLGRYAGVADLFGPALPEPLLPPLDVLADNLAPATSIGWHDADGWHTRSVTPFPGATLLSEQGGVSTIGTSAPLMGSILLPALNRARETENRVKSGANLSMMYRGMLLHADANRGKFPDHLGILVKDEDMSVETFANPRSSTELPDEAHQDVDAAAEFARTSPDYVYLGKGLTLSVRPDQIVAYENPEGLTEGINILFGDGHVEFLKMNEALGKIREQRDARGLATD